LLASTGEEDRHIKTLARLIAQDQALTAKTLRLANSSFYGMPHEVTTIPQAIAIVGFRTVRSLATTAALIGTFAVSRPSGFDVNPFWRHAIAAAVCARSLATHLQEDAEFAYTAGLLHDIGRLVLVTQFTVNYEATMAWRSQHDCSLLQAEQAVLGMDHAAVGHVLTQHWKFPEAMQQAVACHHSPDCDGLLPMSLLVSAADAIVHGLDLSRDQQDAVPLVAPGLWAQLGLSDAALVQVFSETEAKFAEASEILKV
jgi:putative nucleotidyltransferase with HDIG domain